MGRFQWSVLVVLLSAELAHLNAGGSVADPRTRVLRTYAVVAGAGRYLDPRNNLPGVDLDLRGMQSVLTDPNAGIVRKEDFFLLMDADATGAKILEVLRRVRSLMKPGENLIFYWSGHSTLTRPNYSDEARPVIVPHDVSVSDGRLIGALDFEHDILPAGVPETGFFIFIGDGCHIGDPLRKSIAARYPNVGFFSASERNETARATNDGSVMTRSLLRALANPDADLDGDGLISVAEAYYATFKSVSETQHFVIAGRDTHKMILHGASRSEVAHEPYRADKTEPLNHVTFHYNGGFNQKGPFAIQLNGQIEPSFEVYPQFDGITFLGPGSIATKIRDGANSVVVKGRQAISDSFVLFKEESNGFLLSRPPFGKSYALIVAVSDYNGSGFPNADGMVEAARKLSQSLLRQGFEVKSLYNSSATALAIDSYLRKELAPKVKPEDRILVYFGGHGIAVKGPAQNEVGYLVTAGASSNTLQSEALPMARVRSEYLNLFAAKHMLFLLDTCFSGISTLDASPTEDDLRAEKLTRYRQIEDLAGHRMRAILTAGTSNEAAINENGGLFTKTLIDAVGGKADYDHNGVVTLQELHLYLWTKVSDRARELGHRQQPRLERLDAYGDGSFLFLYR